MPLTLRACELGGGGSIFGGALEKMHVYCSEATTTVHKHNFMWRATKSQLKTKEKKVELLVVVPREHDVRLARIQSHEPCIRGGGVKVDDSSYLTFLVGRVSSDRLNELEVIHKIAQRTCCVTTEIEYENYTKHCVKQPSHQLQTGERDGQLSDEERSAYLAIGVDEYIATVETLSWFGMDIGASKAAGESTVDFVK